MGSLRVSYVDPMEDYDLQDYKKRDKGSDCEPNPYNSRNHNRINALARVSRSF